MFLSILPYTTTGLVKCNIIHIYFFFAIGLLNLYIKYTPIPRPSPPPLVYFYYLIGNFIKFTLTFPINNYRAFMEISLKY